jgi:hypothetical protein
MLVLPLKAAVRFDLHAALATWLDDSEQQVSFQPTNPLEFVVPKPDFDSAACHTDLVRLQSLRHCLSDALLKPASHQSALEENALADCHEYHAALLEFEKRGFPTLDDEHNGLALTWKGAFEHHAETHATLLWDRANAMFNIAALETSLAAACSPADRVQCKQAVAHCQAAAGVLQVLRQLAESQDFRTVDFSKSLLLFWENMCLAQAQNSIYRMAALAPDTKHSTLASLAQAAYQLFNEALAAAQDPRLLSQVAQEAADWGAYCKAASMLAASKAEYHTAVCHRLVHEWGPEIARLAEAVTKLQSLQQFCAKTDKNAGTGVTSYTARECKAILPVIQDRLLEAEKDNHNIYQETVPRTFKDIEAKQLARVPASLPASMMVPTKALFLSLV